MWKAGQCVTILHRKCRIEKLPEKCSGLFCNMCERGPCNDKKRGCLKCEYGLVPVHIY